MEALTPEALRWAAGLGITPERAAFLAACPKYTKCGGHMRHKRPQNTNPNRYLMKSGSKYYFRVHSHTGKDTVIKLGSDIEAARKQRDVLLAELKARKAALAK
jgi:hypothetical protein